MKRQTLKLGTLVAFFLLLCYPSWAQHARPVVLDPTYNHDRYATRPADIVRHFRAYTTSFDSADDDNGDGIPDTLRVPQWVAYQIKRFEGDIPPRDRPRWFTDDALAALGIAPDDASYAYSSSFRRQHPDWYVRGHLCMKHHAERLGADAGWNTHTMLNAVPQRAAFNSGIWLDLENRTAEWADSYGSVWIVTGPVFFDGMPENWLGETENGEMRIAIPDALFKIVVRESGTPNQPDVLAFLYPQEGPGYGRKPYDHRAYMVSLDSVEAVTGLDFLSALPEEDQAEVESSRSAVLWPVGKASQPSRSATMGSPEAGEGRVNINTATLEELETLPGVGPVIARRIAEGRPYKSVGDLTRVKGIGKKMLERIRLQVVVE